MKNNDIIHQWSIVCQKSSVDQGSNLLSLFNNVEEITASDLMVNGMKLDLKDLTEKKPIVIAGDMEHVTLWRRGLSSNKESIIERDMMVEWVSPAGAVLIKSEASFKIEAGKQNTRVIFKIDKIAITTTGTYLIRLFIKEPKDKVYKGVTETPIDMKII